MGRDGIPSFLQTFFWAGHDRLRLCTCACSRRHDCDSDCPGSMVAFPLNLKCNKERYLHFLEVSILITAVSYLSGYGCFQPSPARGVGRDRSRWIACQRLLRRQQLVWISLRDQSAIWASLPCYCSRTHVALVGFKPISRTKGIQ